MNNKSLVQLNLRATVDSKSRVGRFFCPPSNWVAGGQKSIAHPTCHLHGNLARQSGAVLVISLIMLLLLTIIGVTGSQVTGLEEKMAGNSRSYNQAFQAAESALRAGEAATANIVPANIYTGAPSPNINWNDPAKQQYITSDGVVVLYVIEQLTVAAGSGPPFVAGEVQTGPTVNWYRITARDTTNAVVTLQSVYKR